MNNRIYATDTHFMVQAREYSLEEQCRIVKECGYDDYYATAFDFDPTKVAACRDASASHGLGFSGAYVCIDIAEAPEGEVLEKTLAIMRELSAPSDIEVAIACGRPGQETSDPDLDKSAIQWIEAMLPVAEEQEISICLYPHFGLWMEKFGDCLRLLDKVNLERVGVAFTGYHWFRSDNTDLGSLIGRAGSHLRRVNLCGSRLIPEGNEAPNGLNPSIEPLDSGELDNKAIIAQLRSVGYCGPIGILGYSVTAEAADALQRSATQLREWMA